MSKSRARGLLAGKDNRRYYNGTPDDVCAALSVLFDVDIAIVANSNSQKLSVFLGCIESLPENESYNDTRTRLIDCAEKAKLKVGR